MTEKHPTRVPDKLKLLRRLFRWHPAISEMAGDVEVIVDEIGKMTDTRNVLTHSIFERVDEDHQLIFNAFKITNGKVEMMVNAITFSKLGGFAARLDTLTFDLSGVSSRVFDLSRIQQLRTVLPRNPEAP